MKKYFCMVLILIISSANAQVLLYTGFKQLAHSIQEDGNVLRIKIDGQYVNGKKLRYRRSFPVSPLTLTQRDSIKSHVLDSLGIRFSFPNAAGDESANKAFAQSVLFECRSCGTKGHLEIYGTDFLSTRKTNQRDGSYQFPISVPLPPGRYQLLYYDRRKSKATRSSFEVAPGSAKVIEINPLI